MDFDWVDEEDEGLFWEGVIVYRRNFLILYMEYCIILERFGLDKFLLDILRFRVLIMGLRVIKAVKDYL